MEVSDGLCGGQEVMPAAPMVAEDPPLLEARDDVLDSCATSAMPSAGGVPRDSIATKHGRDELGDTAVTAVCEHASVQAAQLLDEAASI